MSRTKIHIIIIIFLFPGFARVQAQVIGSLRMEGPNGILELAVVTEQEAQNAGHGVVKVTLENGVIGAASLGLTSDADASPVRVCTPYGTRAWKVVDYGLFAKAYGGNDQEIPNRIMITNEGGLAMAGTTYSYGAGSSDDLFLKLDAQGSVEWCNAYGYSYTDQCNGICQLPDGSYILAGMTYSGDHFEDTDRKKIDSNGNLIWEFWSGYEGFNGTNDVIVNSAGDFMVCNYKGAAFDYDVWIRNMNASTGNSNWGYIYARTGHDEANAIVENSAGGYAVAGYTEETGNAYSDINFFTIDSQGTFQFSKQIGGDGNDEANDLICDSDGNYLLAGFTGSFGAGSLDYYVKKLDAGGNNIWGYAYGGSGWDYGRAIIQTSDGGYAITGSSGSFSGSYNNIWLIKIANDGQFLWGVAIGGQVTTGGMDLKEGADGTILVAGNIYNIGAGSHDFLLFKVSPDGSTCLAKNKEGEFVNVEEMNKDIQVILMKEVQQTWTDSDFIDNNTDVNVIPEGKVINGSLPSDDVTPVSPVTTVICN